MCFKQKKKKQKVEYRVCLSKTKTDTQEITQPKEQQ